MRAILEAEEVAKSFGDLSAVDRVSFAVKSSEILGIAGPNGSGKTTLFNLVTRIPYGPDTGRVRFKGVAIERMAAHRIARLGLVRSFQGDSMFPSLSAADSVRLAAAHGGRKRAQPVELEALLEDCGIGEERLFVPSSRLSVFEKRKLAIATALATGPELILLDEPAAGLTRPEIDELARLVRELPDRGITVVIIEHVVALLVEVCSRLLVMNQGRIIATGEPAAVMRDERVVDTFLGRRGSKAHAAAGN